MMNFSVKLFSVLLAVCLIAGTVFSASAYEAELAEVALDPDVPDEIHTEIGFSDGSVQSFSAAPDIEAIDEASYRDEIEGYQVFYNSKAILDVEFTEYYSAEFSIPDTAKNVFLAGLTAENIEETQQWIIDHYSSVDTYLSLEDLSFIDTEKTRILQLPQIARTIQETKTTEAAVMEQNIMSKLSAFTAAYENVLAGANPDGKKFSQTLSELESLIQQRTKMK